MFSNKLLILFAWILLWAVIFISAGKGKKNKNVSRANTTTTSSSAESSNLSQQPDSNFIEITINLTKDVFYQSYQALNNKTIDDFKKKKLKVQFKNEIGVDMTKEWFAFLSTQFLTNQLLSYPDNEKSIGALIIADRDDELPKLEFIGKITALAIYYNQQLSVCFGTPILKVLKKSIDIDEIDRILEKDALNIQYIKNSSKAPTNINNSFNNALLEHIRGVIDSYERSSKFVNALLKGFNAILPKELIGMFNITELKAMLCGVPLTKEKEVWDVFKTKISFDGFSNGSSIMNMFWKILEEFNDQQLSQLLKIMTSLPRLPKGGVEKLSRITIRKKQNSKIMGITGNIVYMPEYKNQNQMSKQLLLAVKNADMHIQYLQSVPRKFILDTSKGQGN